MSRLSPSVTRVVICVSQAFCSTDQEKRETARSLIHMSLRSTGKSQQAKAVTDRGIFLHKIRLSSMIYWQSRRISVSPIRYSMKPLLFN